MKEQLLDYLVNTTGVLTLEDILLNFLVAAVIGAVIFVSYRISHSNALYSARFNVTLVMLTLVTTLVMNVIGNNVALSLGMVGALSIVRFRTPIKDSRDTVYIFWCIAVGICCGVSEFLIAAVGTGVLVVVMILFGFVKSNERYLLVIRGKRENMKSVDDAVRNRLGKKIRLRVRNTTASTEEYIYEIGERVLDKAKKNGDIVDYFYDRLHADCVNIVCQNDEINR